jgi:hypothetical protein
VPSEEGMRRPEAVVVRTLRRSCEPQRMHSTSHKPNHAVLACGAER